jgi:hypothetical protein
MKVNERLDYITEYLVKCGRRAKKVFYTCKVSQNSSPSDDFIFLVMGGW